MEISGENMYKSLKSVEVPAGWESAVDEIKEIKHEWFNLLQETSTSSEEFKSNWEKERDAMIAKVADAGFDQQTMRTYVAYQIIVGGTPDYSTDKNIDFEGDLSIKKHLENRVAELKEKRNQTLTTITQ